MPLCETEPVLVTLGIGALEARGGLRERNIKGEEGCVFLSLGAPIATSQSSDFKSPESQAEIADHQQNHYQVACTLEFPNLGGV